MKLANFSHFCCHSTFHNIPSLISSANFILIIAPPLAFTSCRTSSGSKFNYAKVISTTYYVNCLFIPNPQGHCLFPNSMTTVVQSAVYIFLWTKLKACVREIQLTLDRRTFNHTYIPRFISCYPQRVIPAKDGRATIQIIKRVGVAHVER